jgi:ABC-2 type transport system ATP-binding protein
VTERESEIKASPENLLRRKREKNPAVDGISFGLIPSEEVVGFFRPNGAGKTITLKMISGLLHPAAGEISVLGHIPYQREKEFLPRITPAPSDSPPCGVIEFF